MFMLPLENHTSCHVCIAHLRGRRDAQIEQPVGCDAAGPCIAIGTHVCLAAKI